MYSTLKELVEDVNCTTANRISASRILMLPFFIIYHWLGRYDFSFALAFYMIISDIVDGYIARLNNEASEFGKILDPIADKAVTFGLFGVLLTGIYFLYSWAIWWQIARICLILLTMEVFLLAVGYWAAKNGVHGGANLGGKAKMFVECYIFLYTYCFLFVYSDHRGIEQIAVSVVNLLWFAVVLASISIFLHLYDFFRLYKSRILGMVHDKIEDAICFLGVLMILVYFVLSRDKSPD